MVFKKGNVPWNKGLKGEEYLEHYGGKRPNINWKPSKEYLELRSKIQKENIRKGQKCFGHGQNPCFPGKLNAMYGVRLEQNVERMKKNNPMFNKEISKKVHKKNKEIAKEKMKNPKLKEEFVKRMKKGLKKPTQPEKIMINLIKENNLPFNYVGNGNIWFKGFGTMFNPDFLSKNPKHIIEVFGDYWHRNTQEKDKERLATYRKYGYKILVIWESELIKKKKPLKDYTQVIEKINKFIGGN